MMIYINDSLRISKVDGRCLQVEVLRDVVSKKDKSVSQRWQSQGYYGSLEHALHGALERLLNDTASISERTTIEQVAKQIERIKIDIYNALNCIKTALAPFELIGNIDAETKNKILNTPPSHTDVKPATVDYEQCEADTKSWLTAIGLL